MKKALPLIVVGLVAASLVRADNLRSMIQNMNRKVCHAMMKKDMAAFEKCTRGGVTSDFKYSENGQAEDYDSMLAHMKQGLTMMKTISTVNTKLVKLTQEGNSATATTRHHMVGIIAGPDKKNHKMVFDGISTDGYRKEDGKWKLASMTWGDQKMTMDGKPFNPMQGQGGQ